MVTMVTSVTRVHCVEVLYTSETVQDTDTVTMDKASALSVIAPLPVPHCLRP